MLGLKSSSRETVSPVRYDSSSSSSGKSRLVTYELI
jgi:hypothetical protein